MVSAAQLLASLPMPRRIAALPRDRRGYPVPRFVAWFDGGRVVPPGSGVPDFRVVDTPYIGRAVRHRLCWICGEPLGRNLCFPIGPMCVVNRVTSEPASHLDCASYAARVCPFLAIPTTHRTPSRHDHVDPPGGMIPRNPGVIALYTTRNFELMQVPPQFGRHGFKEGVLFRLGEPDAVQWFAEGGPATGPQVIASLRTGLPALMDMAKRDPADPAGAIQALVRQVFEAEAWLPAGTALPEDLIP